VCQCALVSTNVRECVNERVNASVRASQTVVDLFDFKSVQNN